MDLALHLGCDLASLDEMTGVEFLLWQRYAAKKMLPWRRMELYLAQIAHAIAVTMGGAKESTLADFMFDPDEEPTPGEEFDAEAVFGFAPRNKAED